MCARTVMRSVTVGLLAVTCLYIAFTYRAMPQRVPTHFDVNCQPDAWGDKSTFLTVLAVSMGATVVVMQLIFAVVTSGWMPESLMNIPRKAYWFATPQRKAEALQKLAVMPDAVTAFLVLVVLVIWHGVYEASVRNPWLHLPAGSGLWLLIGLTAVFCVGLGLYVLLAFRPRLE